MNYNADYFIAKFEAIPDEFWYVGNYCSKEDSDRRCALGHCGEIDGTPTLETRALDCIAEKFPISVARVNDGKEDKYQQPTPKARILAFLRDAKEAGL